MQSRKHSSKYLLEGKHLSIAHLTYLITIFNCLQEIIHCSFDGNKESSKLISCDQWPSVSLVTMCNAAVPLLMVQQQSLSVPLRPWSLLEVRRGSKVGSRCFLQQQCLYSWRVKSCTHPDIHLKTRTELNQSTDWSQSSRHSIPTFNYLQALMQYSSDCKQSCRHSSRCSVDCKHSPNTHGTENTHANTHPNIPFLHFAMTHTSSG